MEDDEILKRASTTRKLLVNRRVDAKILIRRAKSVIYKMSSPAESIE